MEQKEPVQMKYPIQVPTFYDDKELPNPVPKCIPPQPSDQTYPERVK